ncbi:MAG: hypothetical protein ACR2O0_11920, partial [Rhizobiaceae bacterium]
ISTANKASKDIKKAEIGVRPEYVTFSDKGLDAKVVKVSDAGRFNIVDTVCAGQTVKLLVQEGASIPSEEAKLAFAPGNTRIYSDGWLTGDGGGK